MSVLQVLHIPDERLRKVAKPVEEVNAEIQRIVDDMFETMYAEEGIGLAATQVDIHQRIIVIDVSENRDERLVLINPELLEKSGETGIEEGCPVQTIPDENSGGLARSSLSYLQVALRADSGCHHLSLPECLVYWLQGLFLAQPLLSYR